MPIVLESVCFGDSRAWTAEFIQPEKQGEHGIYAQVNLWLNAWYGASKN